MVGVALAQPVYPPPRLLEDGVPVPGGEVLRELDLSTASFDAVCTAGSCVVATGTDVLLDGSGKIGQANDFALTVDLASKKLILPNGTASPSSSCTTGEIYIDSDADPFVALTYCKTTNTQLPIAPRVGTWTGGWVTTGGTGLAADNTTRYLYIMDFGAGGTTETNFDVPSPITGKLWGMSVGLSAAPGAARSRTITLRRAAASTGLACTVAGTAQGCTVLLSTPVTVSAGDLLNMMAAAAGTPAASDVTYTILWTANAF